MTELVRKYNENGQDPLILGDIFSETKTLLHVITSKYSKGDVPQEDLMQEARLKLIKVIPKYTSGRGKVYSYFSVVIRNAAVDYIRKHRPDIELENIEDISDDASDMDYVNMLADELRAWFVDRFTNTVSEQLVIEILESILSDLMDANCGKKHTIDNLREDFEFTFKEAKTIYESVFIRLRMMIEPPSSMVQNIDECSLQPEMAELAGADAYRQMAIALAGLSVKFDK